MTTEETKFQPKDYKSDQYVRWCPGCGDHAVLNCLHKAMAEVGVAPHNMAVISGIGCSSRLPYYMNTYGFHTIHGRGAAIATGVKTARPDLSVWLITGDGDCLAIGGNHFIHAVRRNIDLDIVVSYPRALRMERWKIRLCRLSWHWVPVVISSPARSMWI